MPTSGSITQTGAPVLYPTGLERRYLAVSAHTAEQAEFATYSAAAWWLQLINDVHESRARRLG